MLSLPNNSGKLEKGDYSPHFAKDIELEGVEEVKFCGEVKVVNSQVRLSNLEIESSYFSGQEDSSLYLENCTLRCKEPLLVHTLKLTLLNCLVELTLPEEETLTCLEFNSSNVEVKDSSISISTSSQEVTLLKSLNSTVSFSTSSFLFQNEEFLALLFSYSIESSLSLCSLSLFLVNPLSILFNQSVNSTFCAKKINISSSGFIPFQLGDGGKIKKITVNGENVSAKKIVGSYHEYFNSLSYPLEEDVEVDTSSAPVIFELPPSGKEITILNPSRGLVIIGKEKRREKKIKLCRK